MMRPFWETGAQSIPDEAMGYIRVLAVRSVQERGYSVDEVSGVLGLSRSSIYDWLRRYDEGGYPALETRQAPGAQALITEELEDWLADVVEYSTPEDFGYETPLWTCARLAEVLERTHGVKVGGSCINQHLHRMGLSVQRPGYVAREGREEEVRQFLEDDYPRIKRLADRLGADIGFEDEAGVDLRDRSGTTWAPVGQTPTVEVSGQRGRYNVFSMVTSAGELDYRIVDETINSARYIAYLEQLIEGRTRPLVLLVDRAAFHRTQAVREFVRAHRDRLKIFFLPRYRPQYNPSEQVWQEIKQHQLRRQSIKNKGQLKERLTVALDSLKNRVQRVKSFFQLPETQYAA